MRSMRVNMDWVRNAALEVNGMQGMHSLSARKQAIKRICLERDFVERTIYEDAIEDEVMRLRLGVKQ